MAKNRSWSVSKVRNIVEYEITMILSHTKIVDKKREVGVKDKYTNIFKINKL
jgi:hypothetical protein